MKELENQTKGSQQQKNGNACPSSDSDYHDLQIRNLNNTQNKSGISQYERNIPGPVCFEPDVPQSEAADHGRYATIQLEKLPEQKQSPDVASSLQRLNDLNVFDVMMEEMPTFVLDPKPGICCFSALCGASKDLETHRKKAPEKTLQHPRQFQQQKFDERRTGTNTSATWSPKLPSETPGIPRGVYLAENKGKTALHISVERASLEIVRFLLLYGVDVNRRDDSGRTALHYGARGAHINIVAELLIAGADLEARDNEGRSPLHAAADAECEQMIRLLVQEGADLNAVIGISSIEEGNEIC